MTDHDRTGGSTLGRDREPPSPRRQRQRLPVFLATSAAILLLFFGYLSIDAPGGRILFIVTLAVAMTGAGLWFVAPEFYEIDWMRMLVVEFLAAGVVIVLAYRLAFTLLPISASPNRSYPLWQWLLAALLLEGAITGAALVLVSRRTSLRRIRRIMVVFGVIGLEVAIAAAATYAIDIGYTAERWGLVSVWIAYGFYPALAVPTHALISGIVGWGWALTARTRNALYFGGSLLFAALVIGAFNYSVVRDPFWGLLAIPVALGIWAYLFATNPENVPMVDPSLNLGRRRSGSVG